MDVKASPSRPNYTGLSFRDLEYVVAVADLRSFVRAAQHCHVAQPSLSVQVRRIEERLRTTIFERSSRGVQVTPAGVPVVAQMRRALAEGSALLALADRPHTAFNGVLRLSGIGTLAPYLFPRILPGLRTLFPGTELLLGEGAGVDLLSMVAEGTLDAAIVTGTVEHRSIDTAVLQYEMLMMACPEDHAAAQADGPDWHALHPGERLFLGDPDCLRADAVRAADAPASGRPSRTLEALMYRVAAGEGCALVPAFAARPLHGIVYRRSERVERQRELVLAWRTNTLHSESLRRLVTCVATIAP